MNASPKNKIACLPKPIRDQLHRRIEDDGQPINPQNLSDWRQGGYRDWLAQLQTLELARRLGEDATDLQADGRPPLTDTLALWLAARYAVAARRVTQAEGAGGWRTLRELCADVVDLRRGDHTAQRLRLDREQMEWERQRQRQEAEPRFRSQSR